MNDKQTETEVVFRTGQLYEIDMAASALEEHGVPHYTQEETSSGLKLAMPAAPATGPGTWWSLLVPRQHAKEAKDILEGLPFCQGTEPGVWGFKPRPKVKLAWKVCAVIVIALTVVLWLFEILN